LNTIKATKKFRGGYSEMKRTIFFVALICSYLIAVFLNFIPSIKDSAINIVNLLVSVLFMIIFLVSIKTGLSNNKTEKKLKVFLLLGSVTGLFVYFIAILENAFMENIIYDIISGVSFPFYILFITPFFGFNYLFNWSYEIFSLLISLVYVLSFILIVTFKRSKK
jgi:hypothetical protein